MSDGLLLLDKPSGPTSHDVVNGVRRSLGRIRCGHAGTLDPVAGGLLVLALGRATRLLRFLAGADKTYEGVVRLGIVTDTDDATGRPLGELRPALIPAGALDRAVKALSGTIEQRVPAFSARKHEGIPLYRLARQGRPVPEKTSTVRVAWELCEPVGNDRLRIRVAVSAGTYIRALARDMGEMLGTGAHLESLRRLSSGPFEVTSSIPWPAPRGALLAAILPLELIPLGIPTVSVSEEVASRLRTGTRVLIEDPARTVPASSPLPDPDGPLHRRAADVSGAARWDTEPAGGHGPSPVRVVDPEGRLIGVGEALREPGPEGSRIAIQPRTIL